MSKGVVGTKGHGHNVDNKNLGGLVHGNLHRVRGKRRVFLLDNRTLVNIIRSANRQIDKLAEFPEDVTLTIVISAIQTA